MFIPRPPESVAVITYRNALGEVSSARWRQDRAADEPPLDSLASGARGASLLSAPRDRDDVGRAGRRALDRSPDGFRIIINDVLVPPPAAAARPKALYLALGLTSVALVLANAAIYGQTYLTAWSGQHLVARLRVRLFDRLMNLPLGEFDKWRPGELLARFHERLAVHDRCREHLGAATRRRARHLRLAFATMIYQDWLLTLSLVLVSPLV